MLEKDQSGIQQTAKKVLGYRKKKSKVWASVSSWKEIQKRRKLKKKVNDAKSEILRKRWLKEYRKKDKMVKRCLTGDKRQWTDDIANEVENARNVGRMKKEHTMSPESSVMIDQGTSQW